MQGLNLVTQMIFVLVYFFFPNAAPTADQPINRVDMSFLKEPMGAYYMALEDMEIPENSSVSDEAMSKVSTDEGMQGELQWENEYELPVKEGNALVYSYGVEIVEGPYKGVFISSDELEMMECVIERETSGSLKHKKIIAELILNRVVHDGLGDSVKGVLTRPRQFTTISNYYTKKRKPDSDTKQAVYEVIRGIGEFRSKGALYFYDPQYADPQNAKWFENDLSFCYEIEGHRFFK